MSNHVRRPRLLAALIPAMLAVGLCAQMPAAAAASAAQTGHVRVGHTVKRIVVPGTAQSEQRQVDVHLWYPADQRRVFEAPKASYTSKLRGVPIIDERYDPLSWSVEARIANENAAIDSDGQALPVIVFSHGSVNDPIDYAYTLKLVARAGFVVAAPYHVNNTQDDVRIDFINANARVPSFPCHDGRPSPCSRTDVPLSMADRVRDISHVLDNVPGWFGARADVSRAGVLGHSRGTATALAAAGGSAPWRARPELVCVQPKPAGDDPRCWPGVVREPRIKAVMGLAIAVRSITFGADLRKVEVPAMLVAGTLDRTSPHEVSWAAFEQLSSTDKSFVSIANATHRTFDSTYCAQMQAAGAIAQANPRAILDWHTVTQILRATAPTQAGVVPPVGTSGEAMDYCSFSYFTSPVDIRPLVASITGFNVTPDNVPRTGLETEEVKERVNELAVTFFGRVLKPPAPPAPVAPASPRVRVANLPRACASRSFRVRVRSESAAQPQRVTVSLDGRRIRTTTRSSFRVRVPVGRPRPGVHRLTGVAVDAAGPRTARTFRFRVCPARRAPRFAG